MTVRMVASLGRFLSLGDPEAGFIHLANQLEQAVLLVSLKTGMIERANHAATLMTGWGRDELEAMSAQALALSPEFADPSSFACNSPRTLLDVPIRHRSDKPTSLDMKVSCLGGEHDGRLLIVAEDASLRRKREQEVSERQRSLEALNALIALNVNPDEASLDQAVGLVVLYLNAAGAGLYRVQPDQPRLTLAAGVELSPAFPDHIPPDEIEAFRSPHAWVTSRRADNALSQAARATGWGTMLTYPVGDGQEQTGLLFVGYKHGQETPAVSVLGIAARQVYLLFRQLVQHESLKRIAAGHQRVSNQLQAILQQHREAVVIVGPDERVHYLNLAGCLLLGYKPEEAERLHFADLLISPQDLKALILQGLENGTPSGNAQVTLHKRTGEPFPVVAQVTPLQAGAGAMVFLTDQSERVAFERRNQRLEQQAVLGELSAIFAHEVRNPVNNISALAQKAALYLPPDSPLRPDALTIRAEAERISRLLNDVLQFSRPTGMELRPQMLTPLVARVLDHWEPRLMHAGINVRRDFASDAPPALLDPASMERVVINLIDNALNAMPEGGTLSVMIQRTEAAPGLPMLELRVVDTGKGIPADVRARIFSPFFTTRSNGHGLGLAITKNIVEVVHRGTIAVESYPETGTIFTVQLPCPPEPALAPAE